MLMLEYLFLWFLFYSFAGWVYESILVSVSERRLVNRGFLNGPICPIYGCGAVLAIVLLHDLHNPFAVFLISSIGACMLEYVTSWGMEKLFHARWWDYSHRRFNIQGRICLLGAIVFGLLGVLITDVIQPEVNRITQMIPLPVVQLDVRDFHGVYRRGYHYYSAWHHRFGRQSCEVQRNRAGICGESR